jgi:hypothetical protein
MDEGVSAALQKVLVKKGCNQSESVLTRSKPTPYSDNGKVEPQHQKYCKAFATEGGLWGYFGTRLFVAQLFVPPLFDARHQIYGLWIRSWPTLLVINKC